MKKRTFAAVLWSLTGWYVGAAASWLLGIGPILPILFAAGAAYLVGADPGRMIWTQRDRRS